MKFPDNLRDDYTSYHEEGALAFRSNALFDDCPYPSDSTECDAWVNGYLAAEAKSLDV